MNWTVKFRWTSTALGYYTLLNEEEAKAFAKMFGKRIVERNEETRTITIE